MSAGAKIRRCPVIHEARPGSDPCHCSAPSALTMFNDGRLHWTVRRLRIARVVYFTYYSSMKRKTSITLSEDVLDAVERMTPKGGSRSETIERLLRDRFAREARRTRDLKDLEAINRNAEQLNEEAEDVLTYQVDL